MFCNSDKMKTVLVTGASGFLGHHIVQELLVRSNTNVIAVLGRPQDKSYHLPSSPNLESLSLDSMFDKKIGAVDTVINCAFARSNEIDSLVDSLEFTEKTIKYFEENGVLSLINISSQGVYQRLKAGDLSNENSPIKPIDLYSFAKFASEKIFNVSSIPFVTNVRLASIMMPKRFLDFFVQKAKSGERFTVTMPNQYSALLDVTDAAKGVAAIADLNPSQRANVYNLGIGAQYSLLEYAQGVKKIGESLGYTVDFDVVDNEASVCSGMDISKLMTDTKWKPEIMKDEMITKLYKSEDYD